MRTKVGDYIDKVIKEHAEAEAEALKASETEEKVCFASFVFQHAR